MNDADDLSARDAAPDPVRRAIAAMAVLALFPLAGCGGGGGGDGGPPVQTRELYWDGPQGWDQLAWY